MTTNYTILLFIILFSLSVYLCYMSNDEKERNKEKGIVVFKRCVPISLVISVIIVGFVWYINKISTEDILLEETFFD